MHHEFWVSKVVNQYVFVPLAHLAGARVEAGHDVVPAHVVMILLVSLGLIVFAAVVRRGLSFDNPGSVQQILEIIVEGLLQFMRDIIGPTHRRYFPLIGTLFIYILIGNILGLVPGFMSPTSNLNVTAGCGIIVFLFYNYEGFRAQGFVGYLKHFFGPSIVIGPLLFVIEIVSHFARPMSLSLRLFGNIFAEEMVIGAFNNIFPFLIALPVMGLALFASTLQAFIFCVLSMVYIGGAVELGHGDTQGGRHGETDHDQGEAHAQAA